MRTVIIDATDNEGGLHRHINFLILPDNAKSLRVADRLGARLTDTPAPDWYAGARVYHLDKAALA